MTRRATLALLFLATLPRPASAWTSPAPDLVIYTTPTLTHAFAAAAALFRASHPIPIRIFAAPPAGLTGLIAHMARDDIVAADPATLDALAAARLIAPASRIALGADPYILAAATPTAGALPSLLATHTIVVTDPTTAASFDGQALLAQLPPTHAPEGVADTPDIVFTVLHTENRLGLLPQTSLRATPALTLAAALPLPPARIEAAATTHGQSPNTGAFLAFLQTPAAQSALHQAGLETAP